MRTTTIAAGFILLVLCAPALAHQPATAAYAAHQLEESAQRFAAIADRTGYELLSRQALRLAHEARQVRRAARRGAQRSHLHEQFREVAQSYRAIEHAFERSRRAHHDPRIRRGFARVSADYCATRSVVLPQSRRAARPGDPCARPWSAAVPDVRYPGASWYALR